MSAASAAAAATQPLALQTMPSAQMTRGMPEGHLMATMIAYKARVQIQEDKKLCDQGPKTHVLYALPANAINQRKYCELESPASARS
jgi:hypothetical protein